MGIWSLDDGNYRSKERTEVISWPPFFLYGSVSCRSVVWLKKVIRKGTLEHTLELLMITGFIQKPEKVNKLDIGNRLLCCLGCLMHRFAGLERHKRNMTTFEIYATRLYKSPFIHGLSTTRVDRLSSLVEGEVVFPFALFGLFMVEYSSPKCRKHFPFLRKDCTFSFISLPS